MHMLLLWDNKLILVNSKRKKKTFYFTFKNNYNHLQSRCFGIHKIVFLCKTLVSELLASSQYFFLVNNTTDPLPIMSQIPPHRTFQAPLQSYVCSCNKLPTSILRISIGFKSRHSDCHCKTFILCPATIPVSVVIFCGRVHPWSNFNLSTEATTFCNYQNL